MCVMCVHVCCLCVAVCVCVCVCICACTNFLLLFDGSNQIHLQHVGGGLLLCMPAACVCVCVCVVCVCCVCVYVCIVGVICLYVLCVHSPSHIERIMR